jgi:hypothetical protein
LENAIVKKDNIIANLTTRLSKMIEKHMQEGCEGDEKEIYVINMII